MTETQPFNRPLFIDDLDRERVKRSKSWREIAKELDISPSTLTRLRQAQTTPDLNTFTRLCTWAGLTPAVYLSTAEPVTGTQDALTEIAALLRADKSLDAVGAATVEAVVRAAYEKLQQSES